MKSVKKWFNRITSIIFTLIFIFGAYVCFKVVAAGDKKVPEIFGYSFMKVQSGSMRDVFKEGEIILVKKTSAEDVKTGDIISFYSSDPALQGFPNTHRVTQIVKENGEITFKTKGDSNSYEDKYDVSEDRLIGVYIKNLNLFTKFLSLFQSQYSFFFLLFIPLAIIVAIELNNVVKTVKTKKEVTALNSEEARDNEEND